MEYAELENDQHVVEQVVEANAAIPNIPVPKSSDGNVSLEAKEPSYLSRPQLTHFV